MNAKILDIATPAPAGDIDCCYVCGHSFDALGVDDVLGHYAGHAANTRRRAVARSRARRAGQVPELALLTVGDRRR